MSNNLNTKVIKTATRWKERAKKDRTNRRSITRAQLFALELLDYMDTHKIKQKDLAIKMNVTPQQVNKILRAKANLTLDTLDKIEDALGVTITTPQIIKNSNVLLKDMGSIMQVIHRKKVKQIELDITTGAVIKSNPILATTIESMDELKSIVGQN
jgi:transcriptional regulator with XRE-family HTH domain